MLEHGRHPALRDPARRRALLLPSVLLLASGTAFAGIAVLPAAASDRPGTTAPALLAEHVAEPFAATPAHPDVALARAMCKGAAQTARHETDRHETDQHETDQHETDRHETDRHETGRDAAARASRDRRPLPPRPSATPPPAPKPAPQFVRPGAGRVTSPFGQRWGRLHAGLDFAAGIGSPVRAATAGTVLSAATEGGYGKVVRLRHAEGTVTVYAHLSEISVAAGQQVAAGHVVGLEGSTGHSTGPHLHFEVRVHDVPVDPAAWLQARGVAL